MTISEAAELYVAHKRSLGMQCTTMARILRAFSRAMGNVDLTAVHEISARAFVMGSGPITSNLHSKLSVLRGFYRYLLARGHIGRSPLPTVVPKEPEPLVPYIYSRAELRRIVDAGYRQRFSCKIEDVAMHALLLLLYGAGLRISEALRLTLADIDWEHRVLTIRETKFYKTRLVPVGRDLFRIMGRYLARRRERRHPEKPDLPFLMTRQGVILNIQLAELSFKRLCEVATVRRTDGSRFGPRLHDLRHSFAVHRLTTWYQQGADVQRLLPQLSTFLGHVDIGSTQRYLTMTPELLQSASVRFERYGAPGVSHD
jgi:site-specific recombinase XerD